MGASEPQAPWTPFSVDAGPLRPRTAQAVGQSSWFSEMSGVSNPPPNPRPGPPLCSQKPDPRALALQAFWPQRFSPDVRGKRGSSGSCRCDLF